MKHLQALAIPAMAITMFLPSSACRVGGSDNQKTDTSVAADSNSETGLGTDTAGGGATGDTSQGGPDTGQGGPDTGTGAPTLESCKAWVLENHRNTYEPNGCWTIGGLSEEEWAEYFDSIQTLEGGFGGVLPIGDDRFVSLWIPDDWETMEQGQTLLVGLHGSAGCTSTLFDEWYDYTHASRKYALAAVQWMGATYSEARDNYYIDEDTNWDSGEAIFEGTQEFLDQLYANCPFDDASTVLYGFSRGAARSFHVTACDSHNLSVSGSRYFNTTIADSGGGEFYQDDDWCWADLDAVDYMSSRFWLFCGTEDSGGVNCDHLSSSKDSVEERNGIVDELYMEEGRGHGIFSDDGSPHSPESPSDAQNAMFDYIDSFASR